VYGVCGDAGVVMLLEVSWRLTGTPKRSPPSVNTTCLPLTHADTSPPCHGGAALLAFFFPPAALFGATPCIGLLPLPLPAPCICLMLFKPEPSPSAPSMVQLAASQSRDAPSASSPPPGALCPHMLSLPRASLLASFFFCFFFFLPVSSCIARQKPR
jgi:hypothetical protein